MKRILALLLAAMFLLAACSNEIGDTEEDRETEKPRQDREEAFSLVDDSGTYSLYYYEYTRDYEFDEFLKSGGAANTAQLVRYCCDVFPDMELDLSGLGYGCSSFCAQDDGGDVIFGRNFDMGSANTGDYVVVHTVPEDGYASYSTVNLGFLGITGDPEDPVDNDESPLLIVPYIPLDGINEKGVAICVLQLNYTPVDAEGTGKVDLTPTTIIRNVLDNAKDLDDAIAIFEKANFATEGYAYHFMIGDAKGNAAVVEYVDDELVITYRDGDILSCANTYVCEEGREFYGVRDGNESDVRTDAIEEEARDLEFNLSVKNAMNILAAAHQSTTRWSIVYNLTDGTMNIAVNKNLSHRYRYEFEE